MNEDTSIKEKINVGINVSLVLNKFKNALSKLERVVGSRSTLPILNNILIKVHKGGVELLATDLEVGIKFNLGGKVEKEGSITIPGRTLINLVDNLYGDTIQLSSKNNILTLISGDSKANINGMPADEFPVIPEVEVGKKVTLDTQVFKSMLSQVEFSASSEESRPILTGVYMISGNGSLTLVATDSYRLSETVIKNGLGEEFNVVIPVKTLQEVRRMADEDASFELVVGENQVMFVFKDAKLVSRIIEGDYPNYKQIIPSKSSTIAELDVQEFIDNLKTAHIFSVEGSHSVKLNVKPEGLVEITSESSQLGNFSAKLKAEVKGEGGEISFNARYLLDGLNSFETPRCTLGIESRSNPGVLKPSNVDGRVYIVMPLKQ